MKSEDGSESEDDSESKDDDEDEHEILRQGMNNVILSSRLRKKNMAIRTDNETRKKKQEELLENKLNELKKRFEKGEITTT